jgi:RNA polymerase sigma-70 factor (ECF subfamily)
VAGRDRREFEGAFREHYDAVLSYALARTDPDMARDVAADAFLVAWRRWQEVPDAVRPWLLGVARRALADQRRSASRQRAVSNRMSSVGERPPEPVDPAEQVVERALVRAALARLRPQDRELLCLLSWDGLSPAEAADALGCSRLAVTVRLHRVRKRFEAALDAEESASRSTTSVGSPAPVRAHGL